MVSPVDESGTEEGEGGDAVPVSMINVEGGRTEEAVSPLEGQKKRKATEFSHASTKHWKQHFTLLDEHHYSAKGVKGHRLGYCTYCMQAATEPTPEQRELIMKTFGRRAPKEPPEMQIYKPRCEVHLGKCQWLPREVKEVWQVSATKMKPATLTKPLKKAPNVPAGTCASRSSVAEASVASSSIMDIRSFTIKRGLTPLEIPAFQKLIFNLIIDTRSPFTFAEEAALGELVHFLRPGAEEHIPSRRVVSGSMLRSAAVEAGTADEYFKQMARNKGYLETLTLDGWQDVSKIHIDGVLLMIGPESYMEESEIAGADHHGLAVANVIEKLYGKRQDMLASCVMDEAGQCGRAKRILRRRHPHWVLDACWAHQVNLMVKALLKIETFAKITDQVSKISKSISKSSAKWAKRFYDIVDDTYERDNAMRLLTLAATRWNSAQAMFASQLRVSTACKVFCVCWAGEDGWAKEYNSWQDYSFWKNAAEAELMIRPLVEASFVLQCDGRTKADVMLVLLNIHDHLNEFAKGTSYSEEITKDIEQRWAVQDQHLFLLAFALHPKYRMFVVELLHHSERDCGNWSSTGNVLSVARLVMASKFYYGKHRVWKHVAAPTSLQYINRDEGLRKEIVREHTR